jgi:hypothetical protein
MRLASLALLALAGCSLIVGNKLDEKAGADSAPRRDGVGPLPESLQPAVERKVPTVVTGESGATGEGPYLIGEQVEFPTKTWPGAARIYLGGVPCVGGSTGPTILCTVAPNTPDGKVSYVVKDAAGKTLNAALGDPIQIRRLIVGGTLGQRNLAVKDQASLADVFSIDLGESLVAAKLAPSGRTLLARVTTGLVLVDLVHRLKARLPPSCQQFAGTSFEPSFEMILTSGTSFMYFRPERWLWCSESAARPMTRVALPEPPARIADGLKDEPAPVAVPGALQSTSLVDLSGQAWLAGVLEGSREVFALNLTAKPLTLSTHKLGDLGIADQVVITPIEKGGTYALDSYLVARVTKPGQPSRAVLLHPEGSSLARKGELILSEDGTDLGIDLKVQDLVWMPYTNLIAFDRQPGSKLFTYLRVVQGPPSLELVKPAVPSLPPQMIRAFSYSPIEIVLFIPTYKKRVGSVAGDRVVVHQDQPSELQVDATPAGFGGGQAVGHPVYERLFLLSGSKLTAYKRGFNKLLAADGASSPLAADRILIQP